MTIMRVSLVGTDLDTDQKQWLAGALIAAFSEVEVGADVPAVHGGFLVHFEHVAADDLYMGPAPMSDAGTSGKAAVITVQVMAGPWNDDMKREIFGRCETVVREATGMERSGNGADFWMTITEIAEGGWGYGGSTVSIADLAPLFTDDRQSRIARYLDDRPS